MTVSETIGDFAVTFDLSQAPRAVVTAVETAFIDTIGVMLAGSREPASRIAADLVRREAAACLVPVIGHELETTPLNAALVNGISTQALDYDLSFMSGQSTAPLIAGLLPLAYALGSTPRDVISAYVVGAEVCARLVASTPGLRSRSGWHGVGIFGTPAAAVAFARLAGRNRDAIATSLGISVSMASGLEVNFGTMTKPLHAGQAARNALLAGELASSGFTGSRTALEGRSGYFQCLVAGGGADIGCFADFGQRYYLDDPGLKIKPYACGGVLHAAIDAAVDIRERFHPAPAEIETIQIGVTSHASERAILDYPWSQDSARFSPRYIIASALVHGAPQVSTFTEASIGDAHVRALAEKCEVAVDRELDAMTEGVVSPGRVVVTMRDGAKYEKAVLVPAGTRTTPMTREQLRAKFMSCARLALPEKRACELYDSLCTLSAQPSLADVWRLLDLRRV